MKNVLLTTTALVAFAGAAAADVSLSGGADIGYNDEINGEMFYDVNLDISASADLGDGYSASVSYGLDIESTSGTEADGDPWDGANFGLKWDDQPTIEITSPFGSLKGGDLGDKGASEYFYADRDGMVTDVENHDSGSSFDVRALAEFGAFGVAVGAQDLAADDTGLNFGAGGTFNDITIGFGYDDADNLATDNNGQVTAISADMAFGAASIGVSYASAELGEDSTGIAIGYDVSADLSVGVYYADNSASGGNYGASVDYTMDALAVDAYYDHLEDGDVDEFGFNVSYAVSAELTAYAGYFDDGVVDAVSYVGVVYAINDSLSATVSFAEADEIDGPEFKDGTTVMLSASF